VHAGTATEAQEEVDCVVDRLVFEGTEVLGDAIIDRLVAREGEVMDASPPGGNSVRFLLDGAYWGRHEVLGRSWYLSYTSSKNFVTEVLKNFIGNTQGGAVVLAFDGLQGAEVAEACSIGCDADDVLYEGLVGVLSKEVCPVIWWESGFRFEVFGTGRICLKWELGVGALRRWGGGPRGRKFAKGRGRRAAEGGRMVAKWWGRRTTRMEGRRTAGGGGRRTARMEGRRTANRAVSLVR
jgi:hypothetical protein